jgi:Protein of unknown function (DUF2637)
MTGDRWIRAVTVAAVACVGLVAAVLSYRHQYELAVTHGESPLTARLVPLSIDGLLLAGSLAALDAARRERGRAWTARLTVGLGVAMTLWANTVHGTAYGPAGIVISGWPPVALIAAIEVLARMVRPVRKTTAKTDPAPGEITHPNYAVPADAETAARAALAASVAASNPISQRQLMTRFGLTRAQATRVRQAVLAESNGHSGAPGITRPITDSGAPASAQVTASGPGDSRPPPPADSPVRGAHP